MDDETIEVMMQRLGGWCAIIGAAFGCREHRIRWPPFGREPEAVLQYLAAHPSLVLARSEYRVRRWRGLLDRCLHRAQLLVSRYHATPAGLVAVVAMVLGAALYVVNSFMSGTALTALAQQWAAAPVAQRGDIVRSTDTLLMVLGGTWTGVVVLFHGVPFVLDGTAVARSARYPRPLKWIGALAGFGSVVTGALMLMTPGTVPPALYFVFAGVGMVWMVGVGIVLKRAPVPARRTHEALQVA